MEVKKLNILNIFSKNEINNKSLSLLALILLPAVFVTKSFDATLIYLLLFVMYLILTTLTTKLIKLVAPKSIDWLVTILTFVGMATIIAIIADALFINFFADFGLYVYLFALSALPFMIKEDNEEKSLDKGMLDALQSFLVLALVLILIALVRELLGTGGISMGHYTNLNLTVSVFSKYAIGFFVNPFGGLVVLGCFLAIINSKGVRQ